MQGLDAQGQLTKIQVMTESSAVSNFGFDVTPAKLVTALITEKGVFGANKESLQAIAP